MNVGDYPERVFLQTIIGKYAETARADAFEDCIVIDSGGESPERPVIVLNVDHPSAIHGAPETAGDFRFYGRWVAAATCGDVISMGARPAGFALDLALPMETPVANVEAMMTGLNDVLQHYGCRFLGGNLDENALEMVGVAWGLLPRDRIVRRAGARPGDVIAVTASLGTGWSAHMAGKLGLTERLTEAARVRFANYKEMPVAAAAAIVACAERRIWTSGMDLSDGLIDFLYTISARNGVAAVVDEAALGTSADVREFADVLGVLPSRLALEPGYDTPFGHGYTLRPESVRDAQAIFREHGGVLEIVGCVETGSGAWLERESGERLALPPFWDDQSVKQNTIERWKQMIAVL